MENGNDEHVSNGTGNASEPIANNPDNSGNGSGDGSTNSADSGTIAIDPNTAIKRKRGRPPGSGNKSRGANVGAENRVESGSERTAAKRTPLAVDQLAKQIEGGHKLLALFLKKPLGDEAASLFEVSPDESKQLAQAAKNLASHYNITVSPVVMAWIQLGATASAIYGPRVAILVAMKKAEAAQNQQLKTLNSAGTRVNSMQVNPDTISSQQQSQPGMMKFQ